VKVLRVPLDRLPQQPSERHATLRSYFCDKDAEAIRTGNEWELSLAWPGGEERHVDPRLSQGLGLWGGLTHDQMAMSRRRSGHVLRALYDTWTLYSWSEWFARAGIKSGDPLTILHIDDHRDLMSPRLFRREEALVDPITDRQFDLFDPQSVLSAIDSGAVGMGSFLTPILHRFPLADVRQLTQPPKVTGTNDYRVVLTEVEDDLLEPGRPRPAVELVPREPNGRSNYRITNMLDCWVKDVGPGPVLLHIDMDYFNNRFDGDGDWVDRENILDPSLEDILAQIDRVTTTLRSADLIPRIKDTVVAYSPGFFPAEFWDAADQRLERGLKELYA
jgi:hypothetical protein